MEKVNRSLRDDDWCVFFRYHSAIDKMWLIGSSSIFTLRMIMMMTRRSQFLKDFPPSQITFFSFFTEVFIVFFSVAGWFFFFWNNGTHTFWQRKREWIWKDFSISTPLVAVCCALCHSFLLCWWIAEKFHQSDNSHQFYFRNFPQFPFELPSHVFMYSWHHNDLRCLSLR